MRRNDGYGPLGFCGPSRFARFFSGGGAGAGFGAGYGAGGFMGGTPTNSHELSVTSLYFALNNIVLPDVTKEHPDWSFEDRREEAIRRIGLRSADNIQKGYFPEMDRQAVMSTEWDIVETDDGKKMATWNGDKYTTREELWNNFELYARSRGDWNDALEREKLAQKEMEDALVRGKAKGAATWLSHESHLARYLQVWEKEDDGRIVSRQYDVGLVVGRDITQEEASRVMGNISKLYADSTTPQRAQYPHVLSKEAIHINEAGLSQHREVVNVTTPQLLTDHSEKRSILADMKRQDSNLFNDEGLSISHPREYLSRVDTRILQDVPKAIRDTERQTQKEPLMVRVWRLVASKRVEMQPPQNMKPIQKEKPKAEIAKARELIEKKHAVMKREVAVLAVAVVTGIGIHAVPEIVKQLTVKPNREITAVVKSVKRHEQKELRMKKKELRKRREKSKAKHRKPGKRKVYLEHAVVGRKYTERERKKRRGRKKENQIVGKLRFVEKRKRLRKRRRVVREIGGKKIAVAKLLTPTCLAGRRVASQESVLRSSRRERLKRVIRKAERIFERRPLPKREERLWVALVLWMLLRKEEKREQIFKKSHPDVRRGETLKSQYETPWVLLSIIWFLAMRREGNVPQPRPTPPPVFIPQHAVIFAFAS